MTFLPFKKNETGSLKLWNNKSSTDLFKLILNSPFLCLISWNINNLSADLCSLSENKTRLTFSCRGINQVLTSVWVQIFTHMGLRWFTAPSITLLNALLGRDLTVRAVKPLSYTVHLLPRNQEESPRSLSQSEEKTFNTCSAKLMFVTWPRVDFCGDCGFTHSTILALLFYSFYGVLRLIFDFRKITQNSFCFFCCFFSHGPSFIRRLKTSSRET